MDLASLRIEFTEYVDTCGFMTAVDHVVTCVASKISTQASQDADALCRSKLAVELESKANSSRGSYRVQISDQLRQYKPSHRNIKVTSTQH